MMTGSFRWAESKPSHRSFLWIRQASQAGLRQIVNPHVRCRHDATLTCLGDNRPMATHTRTGTRIQALGAGVSVLRQGIHRAFHATEACSEQTRAAAESQDGNNAFKDLESIIARAGINA